MIQVICPVCGAALAPQGTAWRCVQGHCFDVARQGYVNLLTVTQKHSRHPGDTREMVAARRAFLDAEWYAPIAKTLADLVRRFCPEAASVLDAGCGEGYYLSQLGWVPERWGIDISRDAVRYAAARDRSAHWLTATAAHLPFADGGFDCVLSMFALTAGAEFFRVLRPGGVFCGCFYVSGEHKRTDWMIRHVYEPTKFFTPPYETVDSQRKRLQGMYAQVDVGSLKSIAWFICRKAD